MQESRAEYKTHAIWERKGLVLALLFVLLAAAAALWLPRWWERRLYRQEQDLAGVGAHVLSGSVGAARRKIDPGKTSAEVKQAIGQASFSVRTEGSSTHDIWRYDYSDGTMTVNLTDGIVARITVAYAR